MESRAECPPLGTTARIRDVRAQQTHPEMQNERPPSPLWPPIRSDTVQDAPDKTALSIRFGVENRLSGCSPFWVSGSVQKDARPTTRWHRPVAARPQLCLSSCRAARDTSGPAPHQSEAAPACRTRVLHTKALTEAQCTRAPLGLDAIVRKSAESRYDAI